MVDCWVPFCILGCMENYCNGAQRENMEKYNASEISDAATCGLRFSARSTWVNMRLLAAAHSSACIRVFGLESQLPCSVPGTSL